MSNKHKNQTREKESFSWTTEIKSIPGTSKLIRGTAIHPVKTYHPQEWPEVRVFLEEELRKAAETLIGKPLVLDHLTPLDGKVIGAKYEDGALEFVAELNDSAILNLIKNGEIKHCSVEFEWKSLERVNGIAPRGIKFTALSLLRNFPPGDPKTTVEVWEGIIKEFREEKGRIEQLRKEQLKRAEKYGIQPKEGGHLTKPSEYADIPEEQFADPVNYKYPIDREHVRAALIYFNQPENRRAGGYTHEEAVKIMTRIIKAALEAGIEVRYQPDDPVYRDLPRDLKLRLKGYHQGEGVKPETPRAGKPKTDFERLIAHFGEEKAQKLLELIGDEAYKLLPSRGTKIGQEEILESILKKNYDISLKEFENWVKHRKNKISEAIIQNEDLVSRSEIIKRLKAAVFERVPTHWGYGPYEQNRRIKKLIRELEEGALVVSSL